MKKTLLLAAALLALSLPARAGSITFTFTASSGGNCLASAPCGKTYYVDLAKVLSVYGVACQAQNLVQGADPAVPPVPSACTADQTMLYLTNGVMAGIAANVLNGQKAAQINALTPPTPINPQ